TLTLSPRGEHFLLTQEELAPIRRVGRVFPRTLPGRGPVKPDTIREYRAALEKAAGDRDAQSARVRDIVRDLPDAAIAAQLRAHADRNTADPAFIAALLPRPSVHPSASAQARNGIRGIDTLPCVVGDATPAVWKEPVFVATAGRITLIHGPQV